MTDFDEEGDSVLECADTPACLHAAIIIAARDPIYFCTPDYVIREANQPYSEIGGYTREQAIGETVPTIAGARAFENRKHFLDKALAGEPVSLQAWVVIPGKGRRFFDVSYQPVRGADNTVLGVAAFGRDITDLKRADEVLRMYKSVISQMSDRIFIISREFLYKLTNESNAGWYGHTPLELIGRHVAEFVGARRFETEVRPTLERCFKGQTLEYDFEDTDPCGRPVIVGARLEPFRDGEGDIEGAVVTLRDVTETRRLSERLERLALADDLTGLANRRAFETWLDTRLQSLAQDDVALRGFSVVFIDLDDFKIVNDTVGHGAGDRFLGGIAERLGEFGSDTVHVARIGGDEFGMVIDGDDRETARAVCARVLAMFDGHSFTADGTTFRGGASLGLATITPDLIRDATSHVGSVLQWADHACMQAKAAGGRQMVEHSAFDRITAHRRAEIHHLAIIEQALNDPELLSLQRMPVSDVETGAIVMHEALLRLRMPDGSLQGPSMILATAERHGIMRNVDRWVVKAVLERLEVAGADLPVAFNLSSDSLGSPDFTRALLHRLSETRGVAPMLVLEVSERSITQLNASAWKCLADLRGLGCRIALDDFGKGFASFSQLRENTFDLIKIDRVLTAQIAGDPVKKAAISGIVGLADALNLPTVAEYVQDAETFAPLKDLGVRYAQGHFIGRPERWPLPRG
ncbi:sensor domain-containing protein [Stappia stellulata]|uniref:sensor domain-containing protein n=1 Tax=Stappia stellulata TaxID=71235 RepID=UPI00041EEC11|nr:GGDEF and EAL domain-containing protein [Stappia stellulata]